MNHLLAIFRSVASLQMLNEHSRDQMADLLSCFAGQADPRGAIRFLREQFELFEPWASIVAF
jgi:hypothetical protein